MLILFIHDVIACLNWKVYQFGEIHLQRGKLQTFQTFVAHTQSAK